MRYDSDWILDSGERPSNDARPTSRGSAREREDLHNEAGSDRIRRRLRAYATMSESKPPKRRLRKDDLRTFSRLLVFAKPYWWRLAIGAVTSALGGGSIIAMFIVAQQLLSFLVDNHDLMEEEPAPPAIE